MKRKHMLLILVSGLSLGLYGFTEEQKTEDKRPPEKKKQTHCPVMQRYPVDGTQWIDVKGKRVYVCCKGCINQVKANPDKYIKRLEDKGVVLEKAPVKNTPANKKKTK